MDIFMIAVMVWLGITFLLAIFAAGVAFGLSDYATLSGSTAIKEHPERRTLQNEIRF